ncbi:MAG: VanZ family protein [Bacteroidetes bacterium]|nr:VanZ family protein [Bacteroidota bacterium]MBL6963664.1 VanZ family protein [Bacteroidota bacterium]
MKRSNQTLYKYLFWCWLILILGVSSIPSLPVLEKEVIGLVRTDYFIHFVEYFILAMLFVLWKKNTSFKPISLVLIWLIGTAIAFADEIHQLWIPDRTFNPADLLFNSFGILSGLILTNILLINFSYQND